MSSNQTLEMLFRTARTYSAWQARPVEDTVLHQLYELTKWGPTSANSCPARFVFVKGEAAKARLLAVTNPGNIEKVKSAPVTVIIAWDTTFYDQLPILLPQKDVRDVFANNPDAAHTTAFRNSSLQGGYMILAARALGLDCGPMSGFDEDALNNSFFAGSNWRVNFICNIGYGDASALHPRNPRLTFDQACKIA